MFDNESKYLFMAHQEMLKKQNLSNNVDNKLNKKYNNIKKNGDLKMSFVGMYIDKDKGIEAFGDTKSTISNDLGCYEEKGRKTRKVFKFDNFIICTFGLNKILDKNKASIYLEEYLQKQKYDNYVDFIIKFSQHLEEVNSGDIYNFIIGYKDKEIYKGFSIEISKNHINRSDKVTQDIIMAGNPYYYKQKDYMLQHIYNGDKIRDLIENLIKKADSYCVYNPVGGEIIIEKFE